MTSTLPGIEFIQQTAQVAEELPRTDIAAFVGFAQRGPVGVPVVVEDALQYADIFGGDLELAWDPAEGRMHTAHLTSSVRAFFHGGGERCWVVRVAADSAQYQHFPLAGMLVQDQARNWRSADIAARSQGTWADQMLVETRLQATELTLTRQGSDYVMDAANPRQAGLSLRNGDLLRVVSEAKQGKTEHFLRIKDPVFTRVGRQRCMSLQPLLSALQIDADSLLGLDGLSARLPLLDGRYKGCPVTAQGEGEDVLLVVSLDGSPRNIPQPQPGCVLVLDYQDNGSGQAAIKLDTVSYEQDVDGRRLKLTLAGAWRFLDEDEQGQGPALGSSFKAELLTLSLQAHDRASEHSLRNQQGRIDGLGFDPAHPRAWSLLPRDIALYEPPDIMQSAEISEAQQAFNAEVLAPRFPLAWSRPILASVPLGMSIAQSGLTTALGGSDAQTQSERNGLETFSADLFVDSNLTGASAAALSTLAFHHRYQGQGSMLRGLHSLYFVSEVALVAVPDALHPQWQQRQWDDPSAALRASKLSPVTQKDRQLRLAWSRVDKADQYELQYAVEADFSRLSGTLKQSERWATLSFEDLCSSRVWFRVRGLTGQQVGPWSNTQASRPALSAFESCDDSLPTAVELRMEGKDLSRCRFLWSHEGAPHSYEFQEAIRPDFADAVVLYQGDKTQFELIREVEDSRYYRIRAWFMQQGQLRSGPWSVTLARHPQPGMQMELQDSDSEARHTFSIYRDLLRMAAARGDLFCVLGLPRAMREDDANQWVSGLRAELAEEAAVPSYGAIYHPWLMRKSAIGEVHARPPEGTVLADYARQTLRIGAWLSPVNHPLGEVLGLDVSFDNRQWASLNGFSINLLRRQSRGFVAMTAQTLSNGEWETDTDLLDVNVRRLLIVLRRLAIREGDEWVFDNNTGNLQRQIQHQFETLLGRLYRRGALAGSRASEAYQVVVDESVNTLASMDRGQLIVELRVAPSRPLVFLTVRLLQTGTGGLAVETA